MKSLLSGFAFAFGMCIAGMVYAFVTGTAHYSLQLGLLFVVFCVCFVGCLKAFRKA